MEDGIVHEYQITQGVAGAVYGWVRELPLPSLAANSRDLLRLGVDVVASALVRQTGVPVYQ